MGGLLSECVLKMISPYDLLCSLSALFPLIHAALATCPQTFQDFPVSEPGWILHAW